jgi:NAD(P)-dependent dehydrogenase (short-subunit alcohol dehydrogenase family)
MPTELSLEGRAAIVVGVGPGLGRAAALALAREGADIALAARTRATLESVAAEVEALGRAALVLPTDVTDPEQTKRLADAAHQRFGRIDVLVNNAFISAPYELVVDMEVDAFRHAMELNVVGTMSMCKWVAQHMLPAGRGAIVNVTSNIMRQGRARRSPYAAAKAAITLFSQSLADELGPHGIRVNCVAPGHIAGENLRRFYERRAQMLAKTYDEVSAMYAEQMALRRPARPEEIAEAILFFASDRASAITGQSLDVNAGLFFH